MKDTEALVNETERDVHHGNGKKSIWIRAIPLPCVSGYKVNEAFTDITSCLFCSFCYYFVPQVLLSLQVILNVFYFLSFSLCLLQLYQEYCASYQNFLAIGSQTSLSQYYDAHNNYVQQLHATNGMIKLYQVELLPKLLEEIQSSYLETSSTLASAVQVSTEFIAGKVSDSSQSNLFLCSICYFIHCNFLDMLSVFVLAALSVFLCLSSW